MYTILYNLFILICRHTRKKDKKDMKFIFEVINHSLSKFCQILILNMTFTFVPIIIICLYNYLLYKYFTSNLFEQIYLKPESLITKLRWSWIVKYILQPIHGMTTLGEIKTHKMEPLASSITPNNESLHQ